MGKKYVKMKELDKEIKEKSKVIAVMNNKGGCGKTTTAMALGMYLTRTGNNVLMWDNDPQSNLTQRLGLQDDMKKDNRLHYLFKYPEKKPDISLIAEYPYLQRIPGTKEGVGKVGIMPGSHYSESYADELDLRFKRFGGIFQEETGYSSIFNYFNERMNYYKKYYNFIVMDTAPALEGNILNQLAVRVADEIIYPVDGLDAALGIRQILNWMDVQTSTLDTKPNGLFAMVKYQKETKGMKSYDADKMSRNSVYRTLKDVFGEFVCDNGVRELKSLRHATKGLPGFGGKTDYTVLCEEIINRQTLDRENLFEYIKRDGVIKDLESKLSLIAKKVRKRKPEFKKPKYVNKPLKQEAIINEGEY